MALKDEDIDYFRHLAWIYPFDYVAELQQQAEQIAARQVEQGKRPDMQSIVEAIMEERQSSPSKQDTVDETALAIEEQAEAGRDAVVSALSAGNPGHLAGMGPEIVRPLVESLHSPDLCIAACARQVLVGLTDGGAIDAFCQLWADSRAQDLTDILLEAGYLAARPATVRLLTVLKTGANIGMMAFEPEMIPGLIAATRDNDRDIAWRARQTLLSLTDSHSIEALCEEVIAFPDNEQLQTWVVSGGYAPAEANRAAIFYCLTGQWEKYYQLDWQENRPLLSAGYRLASPEERQRFLEVIRRQGHSRLLVELLLSCGSLAEYEQITDADWAAMLDVLISKQQWTEIYRMLFRAPVEWAAEMALTLQKACWRPPDWEQDIWREILELCPAKGKDMMAPDGREFGRLVVDDYKAKILCLAFHPNGGIIAGGASDGRVRLWKIGTEWPWRVVDIHDEAVSSLAFSPDGRQLITAGREGKVHIWNMPDVRWQATVKGQPGIVDAIAAGRDGQILACARGANPVTRLWQWDGMSMINRSQFPASLFGVTAVDCGRQQLISRDGKLRIFPLQAGKSCQVLPAHTGPVNALAASVNGRLLVSLGEDKKLRIGQCDSGSELWAFDEQNASNCLAINNREDMAALVSQQDNVVVLRQIRWTVPLAAATHKDWHYAGQLTADHSFNQEIHRNCLFVQKLLTAKFRYDFML